MEEEVKQDILAVLNEAIAALKVEDYALLKEISNHTIHNASIYQDEDSVSIAVVMFSVFKIVERAKNPRTAGKKISHYLRLAKESLASGNIAEYREITKKLMEAIAQLDNKFKLYIEQVIAQAQIKKGSKLYEHGISLARAAEILGITQWELMEYVGKTNIIQYADIVVEVEERLTLARKLFGLAP